MPISRWMDKKVVVHIHNGVFSSVQSLSRVRLFATPWIAARQASLSITNSGACANSCPSIQWCHPTISSSFIPFSSHLQSFPFSGSFPMSQCLVSGGLEIYCHYSKPKDKERWPRGSTKTKENLKKKIITHETFAPHTWEMIPFEEIRIERDTCTPMFIAALFIIARTRK